MFEAEVAREKAQGHRGPFTRFFGPITDAEDATRVIREMSLGLLILAALQVLVGFKSSPLISVVVAMFIAVPAALLLVTRHRAAAVAVAVVGLLLFIEELTLRAAVGSIPAIPSILFYVLYLILAARASNAAFLRHRFLRNASAPIAPPSGT